MTLTKADIITAIQRQSDYSKNKSAEVAENLLAIIKNTLASGEDLMVTGFGRFCVMSKNERRGRNPATGDALMLRPRKVVTFRCSGKLRDKINKNV